MRGLSPPRSFKRFWVLLLVVGGANCPAWSLDFQLLSFEVSQVTLVQASGQCLTVNASWTPSVSFDRTWGLRLDVGPLVIKSQDPNGLFLTPDLSLALLYSFLDHWQLSVDGGIQSWALTDDTDFPNAKEGSFQWQFGGRIAWFPGGTDGHPLFSRFFVGYDALLLTGNYTHILRFGVGLW